MRRRRTRSAILPRNKKNEIAPDYDAGLFVPPQDVLERLLARVHQWQEGQAKGPSRAKVWKARQRSSPTSPGDQVLRLVGERGVGKTWVLRHLADLNGGAAPEAVYVDLEARHRFTGPEGFVEAVEAQVQQRCGQARSILLLDSVPIHMDEYLRALEDAVLKPHLKQHGSLAIMALIHPSRVCWRDPALRGGETCWLLPFDQPQTSIQLQRLDKARMIRYKLKPSYVQDYSGGLPLLNRLLVRREKSDAFELLLEYCFSRIPEGERERVRNYLEAVCVLEVLEHAAIRRVLAVYHRHHPGAKVDPSHAGQVRNLLRKNWLARSPLDAPGRIALVGGVRRAAREVLKAQDAELYAALNEAAQSRKGGRG